VQRDRARDAVVGVGVHHFQPVKAAVLLQELALDLDGLAVALLLRAHAELERHPLLVLGDSFAC